MAGNNFGIFQTNNFGGSGGSGGGGGGAIVLAVLILALAAASPALVPLLVTTTATVSGVLDVVMWSAVGTAVAGLLGVVGVCAYKDSKTGEVQWDWNEQYDPRANFGQLPPRSRRVKPQLPPGSAFAVNARGETRQIERTSVKK